MYLTIQVIEYNSGWYWIIDLIRNWNFSCKFLRQFYYALASKSCFLTHHVGWLAAVHFLFLCFNISESALHQSSSLERRKGRFCGQKTVVIGAAIDFHSITAGILLRKQNCGRCNCRARVTARDNRGVRAHFLQRLNASQWLSILRGTMSNSARFPESRSGASARSRIAFLLLLLHYKH